MYAVIWINPRGQRATDKIVVCNPLLQRLNAAWAVLKSKAHVGMASVVLSGDPDILRRFVDGLDRHSQDLDGLADPEMVSKIKDLAKISGLSTVEFDASASQRVSGPRPDRGPKTPPPNRPGALDYDEMKLPPQIWEELLERLDEEAEKAEAQGNTVLATRLDVFRAGIERGTVLVALRKSPQEKLYPQHVTKEGRRVWDKVVQEHERQIKKYKTKEEQWAAALILFQREAAQLNVQPFTIDPNLSKLRTRAIQELNRRLNSGNSKADREAEEVFSALKDRGAAVSMTSEQFYEAVWYRGKYYVTTARTIKLNEGSMPGDILEFLNGKGYNVRLPLYGHKTIDSYTDILFEPQGADALYCFVTAYISRSNALLLFGLDETATDSEIVNRLIPAGKQWVRTGTLVKV